MSATAGTGRSTSMENCSSRATGGTSPITIDSTSALPPPIASPVMAARNVSPVRRGMVPSNIAVQNATAICEGGGERVALHVR